MQVFLTSALVGGEWSASRPGRFTQLDRSLCGPQSRSGQRGEERILDSNSDPSVVQSIASRYTDYAIPAVQNSLYPDRNSN
jgi:hypothetical protein